ncbi:MAG: Asp-tRNA(Asn)/Glu-tRNA(Gln) amidotransferase subunit GatB [Puniceicoccales bacterium]|jgi:aspartyl-tRNA(Asn)/glutamyl-tRNA(Gln) amidotransferase subunit B|nr:Asp-tRNA(Asn)/Glu-tRNA(Gln) amidotransferase subunit GatB [Puniceicoccales bacterium]
MKKYEASIGLEIHVQLRTRSKAFSRSRCSFAEEPNTATDPVTMGLPGALPVINFEAIRQTVRAGMLFHSQIADLCRWDRKNYFYPDNPKNYQITQQAQPLCVGGHIEIELPGPARNIQGKHLFVRLNRIHLEEDVGKLTHDGNRSLVDFNRAGVPLAEIVTEPDMHSPEEASACLNSVRNCLAYAKISECDMEKGQMRCDVNVSLRPLGEEKLGIRVEYKNLNSISGVRNAISHEIARQERILSEGRSVRRETRRWDAQKNSSEGLRSKETEHDYCYFPDPDLMAVRLPASLLAEIHAQLPERPFDRQRRFMEKFQLPYTLTSVLCPSRPLSDFFEETLQLHANPRAIANLIANDLLREISQHGHATDDFRLHPEDLAALVRSVDEGKLSKQAAQDLLAHMYQTGKHFDELADSFLRETDASPIDIELLCREAIAACPKAVEEFRKGKSTAINAIKGAVMKAAKGKANPADIDRVLLTLLRQ